MTIFFAQDTQHRGQWVPLGLPKDHPWDHPRDHPGEGCKDVDCFLHWASVGPLYLNPSCLFVILFQVQHGHSSESAMTKKDSVIQGDFFTGTPQKVPRTEKLI